MGDEELFAEGSMLYFLLLKNTSNFFKVILLIIANDNAFIGADKIVHPLSGFKNEVYGLNLLIGIIDPFWAYSIEVLSN